MTNPNPSILPPQMQGKYRHERYTKFHKGIRLIGPFGRVPRRTTVEKYPIVTFGMCKTCGRACPAKNLMEDSDD